jgi:hypothetical protein
MKNWDFYCKKCRTNIRNGTSILCLECAHKRELEQNKIRRVKKALNAID